VKLGGFHQSFEPITKPGLDAMHEEELLEDGNVFPRGLVIKADLTAELREVGQLARVMSENLKQTRHLSEFIQVSDVSDVPFYNRLDVVACPNPATLLIFPSKHLGITSNQHRTYKIIADDDLEWFDDLAS
jgi:hypothetical protein